MPISDHARRLAYRTGQRDGVRLQKSADKKAAMFKACPYMWESELASIWRRGVEEQRAEASE